MVIDINEAKKAFKEYVKKYNPEDEKIKLKISHIERVAQNSKKIAENLGLNQEDIELAELIGLLHDIGRFEQVRLYHTFVDKDSINHGEYGTKILFEEGLIRKFIKEDKFDKIIKLAIINHNRAEIQEGISEREKLHCKIIRDADKTDIFKILVTGDKKTVWEKADLSEDKISDEIYREFIEEQKINYKERRTSADILVCHFCYIYDLNFAITKKIIKENNYIDKLYKRFIFNDEETMKRFNNIYKISKEYIEK